MISFLLSVNKVIKISVFLLYLSCIMALSLLPPRDLPQVQLFEGVDKLVHFLMYLPLSALLCWNLRAELSFRRVYGAVLLSVLWGMFMEIMQFNMHLGRSFSWFDELANLLGAVTGALLYKLVVSSAMRSKS